VFTKVTALVLAAGLSRRMGQLKQLLPVNNKPAIRHCIDAIIASGINDIVAVIRDDSEELKNVLSELPLSIVYNRNAASEMAESLRIGLRAIAASATGVMVCLSDHPLVAVETLKTLLHIHEQKPDRILLPQYNGKNGHPVLFPVQIIHQFFSGLDLREIISRHPDMVKNIQVMDEGIIFDMDTR
jgi:molybdenum cofactor cytidylyltransferase